MRRLMATIKISSPHETTWLYSLGYHLKPHRTQSEKSPLSLTMDEQRILDQQSPHNELGKHHSTRNLKKQSCLPLCVTASERHGHQLRRQLCQMVTTSEAVIAWILTNSLCDIQTVTDGYEMKGCLSCCSTKWQLIQPRTTKPLSFVWCKYFGFLWPTILPPHALSSRMAPKTKEPSSAWYGSPSAPTPPGT